jgi:replicative DNA helicase
MSLHNTELETVIIGSAIARGNIAVDERRLSTLDFYSPTNSLLWSKICEIDEDGESLNPIEIHKRCVESHSQFPLKISDITGLAMGNSGAVRLADVLTVRKLATARKLQKQFNALASGIEDDPNIERFITDAEEAINAVRKDNEITYGTSKKLCEVLELDVYPRLDKFVKNETVNLPFGFPVIDEAINGGVNLGELVLMGAKPKSGKSFLTLQIAKYQAAMGIPGYVVSREMLNYENGFRFLAQNSRFSNSVFRPNLMLKTAEELKEVGRLYNDLPLFFDDKAKTVTEIRREAKRLKETEGVMSVFIDYAQLVKPPAKKQNRSDELESIYYGLKEMAQDLELAVYVLSQFNRVGIKSDRPTMADFDGSSAAEKAGNLIIIWDVQKEYSELSDGRLGTLWIEAGRNVATDEFNIVFHGQDGLFSVQS